MDRHAPEAVRPPGSDPEAPVGVLVVDDQPIFRHAAREVIEATPGFELVGEAASGPEAVEVAPAIQPDLVFVDVRMAGMDGMETSRRLRAAYQPAVVVLVTTDDPLELPSEVGFCGAVDLVRKQDLRPALLRRLWRAHRSTP